MERKWNKDQDSKRGRGNEKWESVSLVKYDKKRWKFSILSSNGIKFNVVKWTIEVLFAPIISLLSLALGTLSHFVEHLICILLTRQWKRERERFFFFLALMVDIDHHYLALMVDIDQSVSQIFSNI